MLTDYGFLPAFASTDEDVSCVIDEVGDKMNVAIISPDEPNETDISQVLSAKLPNCPVILLSEYLDEKFTGPSDMNMHDVFP